METKVLLIAPPLVRVRYNTSGVYALPPLGLAYIAAVLEKNAFKAEIFDMPVLKAGIKDLQAYLKNNKFSFYGLSCTIFNLKHGVEIADLIKAVNPTAKVILGGRCASLPPELIFKYGKSVDILVHGEGEAAMLDIFKEYAENGESADLFGIQGISFKKRREVFTTKRSTFADLDKLPFPARHLLPMRSYRMHPPFGIYPPIDIMETSRGCAYQCDFCGLTNPVRERSPDNVLAEIREVVEKYKTREIHFVDPNFTYNQDRAGLICRKIIEQKIKLFWTCKTRVDLVSEELLKLMAQSGCYMISYGVESGSKEMLRSLNKKISIEKIKTAFNLTHKAGIGTLAYVIIGGPYNHAHKPKASFDLVEEINPDFVLYNEFLPIPGSPAVARMATTGSLTYEDLINFYFGRHTTGNLISRFGPQIKEGNKKFYLRPGYIWQRLKKTKNLQDLLNMFRGSLHLVLDKIKSKDVF